MAQQVVQQAAAGKRGREGLIYPGGREEGAPARPRRRQLRRLWAHHPEGRARRVVSRAWRPPPPGLRSLRRARPAPRLDPRVRRRRPARPHAAQRAAPRRPRPAPQARPRGRRATPSDGEALERGQDGSRPRCPSRRPPTPAPAPRARARARRARATCAPCPRPREVKVERALELFNGSGHQRTVAGLARTLGPPWVSALPDPNAGERRCPSSSHGSFPGIATAWTWATRPTP